MSEYTATVKDGTKVKLNRGFKKFAQKFRMSKDDKIKFQYHNYLSLPIKDNYIFYEAFLGLGILDSPRALFNYLLDSKDASQYTHVWAVADIEKTGDNLKEYSEYSNVIIVQKGSDDYYKYLATCKYLITNSYFDYFFEKRVDQVYINTCCGIPFKHVGYDNHSQPVENSKDLVRNFLMADYLLSANRFMTDTLYKHAFMLEGIFQGKILELGYPRIDTILNSNTAVVYKRLENCGFDTNKKIILYAPTWRGNVNSVDFNLDGIKDAISKMSGAIDETRSQICLRVHYYLYEALAKDPDLSKFLVPFTIDTSELLTVTDVLVTDYSAIFYDFLITQRPILFYLPDYKDYRKSRGLYIPAKKLPGYATSDMDLVAASLTAICNDPEQYMEYYGENYYELMKKSLEGEDGESCQRIVNTILRNQNTPIAVNTLKNYKKQTLVIVDIDTNGKTFYDQLNEYLDNVNFFDNDITILVTAFKDTYNREYFNALATKIRVLEWHRLPYELKRDDSFFTREVRRTLGNSDFDEVKFIGKVSEYWAEFANNVIKLS